MSGSCDHASLRAMIVGLTAGFTATSTLYTTTLASAFATALLKTSASELSLRRQNNIVERSRLVVDRCYYD